MRLTPTEPELQNEIDLRPGFGTWMVAHSDGPPKHKPLAGAAAEASWVADHVGAPVIDDKSENALSLVTNGFGTSEFVHIACHGALGMPTADRRVDRLPRLLIGDETISVDDIAQATAAGGAATGRLGARVVKRNRSRERVGAAVGPRR